MLGDSRCEIFYICLTLSVIIEKVFLQIIIDITLLEHISRIVHLRVFEEALIGFERSVKLGAEYLPGGVASLEIDYSQCVARYLGIIF